MAVRFFLRCLAFLDKLLELVGEECSSNLWKRLEVCRCDDVLGGGNFFFDFR